MAEPAKPRNNFTQDNQESGPILIVLKDRFLPIASGSQMIECAGVLDAQRPGRLSVAKLTHPLRQQHRQQFRTL
jgi:hypothetical protein